LAVARSDVAEIHPTNISLMPPGFANLLTPQEIADLVVYLKQPK
jgi:hypothetical protein